MDAGNNDRSEPLMRVTHRDGQVMVILGGGLLYEEDHRQVLLRCKETGQKFAEALADYVKELREYLKRGEGIGQ